jgi:predicted nucleotidyltransferase
VARRLLPGLRIDSPGGDGKEDTMADVPFISRDIKDLVRLLLKNEVDFVLVGGHAVAFHGFARATMDIDFLVRPSAENGHRVMAALEDFGFGNAGIPPEVFSTEGHVITMGAPPNEIDLVTSLSGASVDDIFAHAVDGHLGGLRIKVISLPDLMAVKRTANRPKDRIDIEELTALLRQQAASDTQND